MMIVNVKLESVETVEEFLARGNKIEKSEKVLGSKSLNLFSRYSANYRAGSGKTRMGKNGSGKARMSESYTSIKHLSAT
ncbi:MAG: hypothetical protein HN464_02880 [Candidatus Marinimicrobia bacterium]|jgi:hypothetical protein|nr:hypothetical protein [Candidatus Neomarinimicrobiota bacterium]